MSAAELTEREKTILRHVVSDFIETGFPVGSRYISKRHITDLGLSSASIRNVLSDLEERGFIDHPHTSAGRIPTYRGYRFYLDSLMQPEQLSEKAKQEIRENLDAVSESELLKESAKLLGKISRQLTIIASPKLNSGILEKMELISLSSTKILVVISIKTGLVRTITLEVTAEIQRDRLDAFSRYLNERLGGLTLQQINETFAERVRDVQDETGLIRLFIDSVDKLFYCSGHETIHVSGADKLLDQPEFDNPKFFRSVIELINNEEIIVHLLEKSEPKPHEVKVTLGDEHGNENLRQYALICSSYAAGAVPGKIAVFGPTRMQYKRMIPLVEFITTTITDMFSHQTKTNG